MTLALYGKTKRRQGGLLLAALMAILFATLGGVATLQSAFADAGNPTTLTAVADTTNPLKITVSGNWSWTGCNGKFVGWAVAWGETGYTSNPVSAAGPPALGPYYMGETGAWPATQGNHVFSPLDANPNAASPCPATGTVTGTWGPLTHTYAAAGRYNICVVIYDIQKKNNKVGPDTVPAIGSHSAVAGGADRNTDNSVETNFTGSGNCSPTTIVVAAPPRTVRIGKLTTTATHPATTFIGTISPGAPDGTFSVALAANAPGPVYQSRSVSAAAQTVTETPVPANWALNGYTVKTDPSGTATCASTENYTGTTATVLANSSNYLVCIKNTYTAPVTTGTVIVKKVVFGSGSSPSDQFGGSVAGPDNYAFTVLDTPGTGLSAANVKVYRNSTTGSYTVNETDVNGYTRLGYSVGVNTGGVYTCPNAPVPSTGGSASQTLAASGTIVFCIFNQKDAQVLDPSVSKTKNADGVTGGFAYWNVNVNNTANTVSPYDVTIIDSGATFVSVSGGACPSAVANVTSMSTPGIACTAAAASTMVVKVSKPFGPAAACLPQTINNSALVKDIAGNTIGGVAVGGTTGANGTEYTISADTGKCGQPGITKLGAGGQTSAFSVTDPANVQWTVSVVNPVTLPGSNQTVHIKDTNVIVSSGPAFTGSATCTPNNATADFQTALISGGGVGCSMPGGSQTSSSITFNVKPSTTVARTCADQTFNNTAQLQVGTQPFTSAVGPTITLTGNKDLCLTQTVKFIKAICPNYGSVPANANFTNVDETGGHANELNAAANQVKTAESDIPANCVKASGWTFNLLSALNSGNGLTNSSPNFIRNVVTGGDGTVTVTLTQAELDLVHAGGLWVSEVPQSAYGFGSLRCYTDVLNGDNDEFIGFQGTTAANDPVICIAFNVGPRDLTIKKVIPGSPSDNTSFNIKVDGLNPAFPIAQNNPKQTEIGFGTHTVTETAATGYAILGWQIVNGANATCPSAPTGASANVSGLDGTATIASGADAVTVCFYNYATTFSGVCGLPNGQFLALDAATVNGLTGYWFTPNVYGWSPNAPLGNPGAGNAFDHQWVQVEDAGTGHRMVWSLPINTGTNTVRVFPSIDHADDGGSTGSAANEANEYTVWGSNDGINWVAQAVGGVPFDPTPGPYIADNAARDFTFPGGLLYRYIGIQVNLAANVGTDAEIDALCAGDPTPLNGNIIVKKLIDPGTNVPSDGTQFSGTISGASNWGPIGFGGTSASISASVGNHTVAETPAGGWTPVGYAFVTNANSETACPAAPSAYTGSGNVSVSVPVGSNQTTLVCVMNTKPALVALPSIKKETISATQYKITVTNGGGLDATGIALTDTFNQGATTQTISLVSKSPVDGTCAIAGNGLSFSCTGLTAPANGSLVITVTMSAYTNSQSCSDQTVSNTVTASFGAAAPIAIGVTSGASNVATNTFSTNRTDCNNGTIAVKKVRDPGASSPADGSLFSGNIDGPTWGSPITFGGVTTPLSVAPGNHNVAETAAGGGWILVGYRVITNSSTTAVCSTDRRDYTTGAASVTAAVATGQLTLVCVMNTKAAPPPPPTPTPFTPFIPFVPPLVLTTPTPTATPVPPTATPTATVKPTEKPEVKPTEKPTVKPIDNVLGEKTPGALSTPIAPSAGSGIAGAAGSINGFFALLGIAILGAGMALMAAGRRKDRD